MMSEEQINDAMMSLPESWRYHWCGGQACACMGGANCSGRIESKGVTKTEWLEWCIKHPDPNAAELRKYDPEAVQLLINTILAHKNKIE